MLNAGMFFVEVFASAAAGSTSLAADAADFAGDGANYGLSLGALAMGGLWSSRAALAKGLAMAAYGVGLLGYIGWMLVQGRLPEPVTMGAVGALALAVNVGVAVLLYAYRNGDANMRSVWLCTRNDAIGNLAVLGAALGVAGTATAWPDLLVSLLMAGLGLASAREVIRRARGELRLTPAVKAS